MGSVLSIIQAVVQLLPTILNIVQAVEAIMPAGTPGAAKLDTAKNLIQSAYATVQSTTTTFEQVWPSINAVITAVVAAHKAANTLPAPAAQP